MDAINDREFSSCSVKVRANLEGPCCAGRIPSVLAIFYLSMGNTCQTVGQFGGKIPLAANSPT